MGVHHFGLSFVAGDATTLAGFDFSFISKLKSLQEMIDDLTGKTYERRYLILGVQPWYDNYQREKGQLVKLIHNISVSHPIDMLIMYTHILDESPKFLPSCVVAGPTIFENSGLTGLPNMDYLKQPLVMQLTTLELMQQADIPETITVLFSIQAGVAEFQMAGKSAGDTVNYGEHCSHRVIKPYEQMNQMFGRVERSNFGWSLHRIELDYAENLAYDCGISDDVPLPLIISHVSRVVAKHRRIDMD
ncbi:hypothetical protein HPB50_003513 [Hyalomma asiaticum]|uniref:Uncharacterized protein n=1 Tax=Hyalomma asiaticum TaxID=266040 RepID=A0ACB7RU31_HYAAI|nr:hypothetical protein HPB50_003513 [Hyalomma asiaticum]